MYFLHQVRDVRLITDNKTRRSKGICYVEFADPESVPLAIGLSGQKLLGVPIVVQPSQAEKNRVQPAATQAPQKTSEGPLRLYVGSLHFNITEDMLRGIFEPFGKVCFKSRQALVRNVTESLKNNLYLLAFQVFFKKWILHTQGFLPQVPVIF